MSEYLLHRGVEAQQNLNRLGEGGGAARPGPALWALAPPREAEARRSAPAQDVAARLMGTGEQTPVLTKDEAVNAAETDRTEALSPTPGSMSACRRRTVWPCAPCGPQPSLQGLDRPTEAISSYSAPT